MIRLKTHFEQIPIEIVKSIARKFPADREIENDSQGVQASTEVTPHAERWREVAERVQQEQDPNRMTLLVQQLIAVLDEDDLKRRALNRNA